MLKEFWEKRKSVIETLGIIIAVGALFISMGVPTNNPLAAYSLITIQIIWLVIITFAVTLLFLQLWQFALELEKNYSHSYKGELFATLKFIIGVFGFFMVTSGWIFIYAVYQPILGDFFRRISVVFYAIAYAVVRIGIYGITKLFKKELSTIWKVIIQYIFTSLAVGYLMTFFEFSPFTGSNYLKANLVSFGFLGVITLLAWYSNRRSKVKPHNS